MNFSIEIEQEDDGRFLAEVISCCAFNLYIERGQDARTTIILRFPLVQSSCASA